jgi:hypothetical protein
MSRIRGYLSPFDAGYAEFDCPDLICPKELDNAPGRAWLIVHQVGAGAGRGRIQPKKHTGQLRAATRIGPEIGALHTLGLL